LYFNASDAHAIPNPIIAGIPKISDGNEDTQHNKKSMLSFGTKKMVINIATKL